jgi:hypothetical protein
MNRITVVLAAAAILAAPRLAPAAGVTTHYVMTREAVKKVSVPELKSLLDKNTAALMCGVSFPDFGTAVDYGTFHMKKPEYGRTAHRPEFVEAYFDHVTGKCAPDYEGCERLVAHFLGVAAHGMEDDLYDELFMNKAQEFDWDDGGRHDLWADEIFVVKYDLLDVVPPYRLPVKDLVEVYRGLGMEVRRRDLRSGRFYHWVGAAGLRSIAVFPYATWSRKMSFTRDHIVTHPGGINHTAEVIARYLEIMWRRLQGAGRMEEPVLETWPRAGADGHEWDSGSLYSRVAVYFTTGMDKASITEDSLYLTGPDGKRAPVSYRIKHEGDNFAALIPERDLAPGATYTVFITTGVRDMKGTPLPGPYSWSFTTADGM